MRPGKPPDNAGKRRAHEGAAFLFSTRRRGAQKPGGAGARKNFRTF
jgi:hypothetical protein